jgi:hypothetical protein
MTLIDTIAMSNSIPRMIIHSVTGRAFNQTSPTSSMNVVERIGKAAYRRSVAINAIAPPHRIKVYV